MLLGEEVKKGATELIVVGIWNYGREILGVTQNVDDMVCIQSLCQLSTVLEPSVADGLVSGLMVAKGVRSDQIMGWCALI